MMLRPGTPVGSWIDPAPQPSVPCLVIISFPSSCFGASQTAASGS